MVHKKMSRPAKTPAKKTADRRIMQKKSVEIKKTELIRQVVDDLPSAYNVDTIVIMPVNVDRNFIYWEVTQGLLNGKGKAFDKGSLKLMVKVFEATNNKEVYSFKVNDRIGKHYMSCVVPLRNVFAEIGILKGKKYTGLIKSDTISLTTVSARTADQEVWMKRSRGSGEIVRMSDSESNSISRYNPFLQKHFQELQDLFESPFSGSIHLRKRS